MNLNGKNVIYVGGFGGIGLATCKVLLKKNIKNLYILDKQTNAEALTALKALNTKANVHYLQYDLTSDIKTMKQKFHEIIGNINTIDVLINGAGVFNDQMIELTVQVNLTGLYNTVVAAIEYMDKRNGGNGGVILNVSSILGIIQIPYIAVYSSTKAALISFTTSLSCMSEKTGITAFAICPGATDTGLMDGFKSFLNWEADAVEKMKQIPKQTADICGQHAVTILEQNKNGAVWAIHYGKLKEITMKNYIEEFDEIKYLQK